jgi:ElaB/YqjD/DUF883 family membrane-anchored ribosome-binding protein
MASKTAKTQIKTKTVALEPDVETQIEALRTDIALLAEALKAQAIQTVNDRTVTARAAATETADVAKEKYDELTTKAEAQIKEKPLTSIAIAVGVGLLLGAITRG